MQIGEKVLFRDAHAFGGEPQVAIVARVWGADCLNLHVIDPNGVGRGETSVLHKRVASEGCSHWLTREELELARLEAETAPEPAAEGSEG